MAFLFALTALAGADDQEITGVTINGQNATDDDDVYGSGNPKDPIGGASKGVIVPGKGSPPSGNTVHVTGSVSD
jgi:hypothetical protein